jgi:tetratricopeptide (TPR) repeat protein
MDTYLPKYENDHSFIMASHVDRLQQSACFKNAEITCISCHNPHKSVTTLGTNYFDNKCMQCHDICDDKQTQNCTSCHMPRSSSSDIMHVFITDHKIGVHSDSKSEKGKFLGLFAINNTNPTNLSKAKAYLKRYESFEAKSIYLDSAWYYLKNSENNFTSFIQYFYLKNDSKGLINFVMLNKMNDVKYTNPDLALAYSRMGEVFGKNNLQNKAEEYHKKAVSLMSFVIDYKIKYGSFLFSNNQINDAEKQYLDALVLNPTIKEIHASLGLIAILKGNYKKAESSLKQAVALDPDYVLAYENLVFLSKKTNNSKATKLYLRKIVEITPQHKAKQILENL